MAQITLKAVSKIYPRKNETDLVAVSELNLEISDHEFVVLAGPAGCGKSSVVRIIAGLEEISKGEIFIGDRRINDVPPKDRDLALVPQSYLPYPLMSVHDNLTFGLKRRRFPEAEIKKRVKAAAGILGIEELLERKPEALSSSNGSGLQSRGLLLFSPKLFLFDEPLANLDPDARVGLRNEIAKLHQRLQATMLYATHDPVEAMALGGRVVVMHNGVVQQEDSPWKLYHEPMNLFVAGFLGNPSMNFLSGTLKQERDALVFSEVEGGTVAVRFPPSERPEARDFAGKQVLLGIRPEDIEVAQAPHGSGNTSDSFPAIVDLVEPTGAETNLYLQTGAHAIVCHSQKAIDRHESGHRMQFQMNRAKAHLFNPDTTLRIV